MDGPNKLLTLYRGKPLAAHVLKTVSALGLADSLAVTGRDADAIADLASFYNTRAVYNQDYADGLGTSIAFGVSRIESSVSGLFIVLGDMPHIRVADFHRAAHAFHPGAIVVPVHRGNRGHPILFCASYRDEFAALRGDTGGRAVISEHLGKVIEVDAGHEGVLQDFDEPQDFDRPQHFPAQKENAP